MIKHNDLITMKAIAICFKPYLKPEEALIYCNLGRTQFAKKCAEFRIYKNSNGYFNREELNKMMAGDDSSSIQAMRNKINNSNPLQK
jgi:hypothetical protein